MSTSNWQKYWHDKVDIILAHGRPYRQVAVNEGSVGSGPYARTYYALRYGPLHLILGENGSLILIHKPLDRKHFWNQPKWLSGPEWAGTKAAIRAAASGENVPVHAW